RDAAISAATPAGCGRLRNGRDLRRQQRARVGVTDRCGSRTVRKLRGSKSARYAHKEPRRFLTGEGCGVFLTNVSSPGHPPPPFVTEPSESFRSRASRRRPQPARVASETPGSHVPNPQRPEPSGGRQAHIPQHLIPWLADFAVQCRPATGAEVGAEDQVVADLPAGVEEVRAEVGEGQLEAAGAEAVVALAGRQGGAALVAGEDLGAVLGRPEG